MVVCECGFQLPEGANFCGTCGKLTESAPVVTCRKCGFELPASAKFCSTCGSSLELKAAAAVPSVSPPPNNMNTDQMKMMQMMLQQQQAQAAQMASLLSAVNSVSATLLIMV